MAIDERARHQLYQRLEEVLGTEEASVLMEHLPPVGWADVATKRDLDIGLDSFAKEFRAEMSELRAELHREMGNLSNRVTALVITSMIGVGGLAFGAARLV